jgi:3-deoxy-manno-octulosonate cytidylyltransferase (CMP-KDO synthetase)
MNLAFTVILAIPARLEFSYLPSKLVAEIGGKPKLEHMLERCLQATAALAIVLCTESQTLADQAVGLGLPSLLTSADCTSGSDRIASVVDHLLAAVNSTPESTIIINVQGGRLLAQHTPGPIQNLVMGSCLVAAAPSQAAP